MITSFSSRTLRISIFAFAAGSLLAAIFFIPGTSTSSAASQPAKKASRSKGELPNYDIRDDKRAVEKLREYRKAGRKTAVEVADLREAMVGGEVELKKRVPSVRVEFNSKLQAPEVISPDVQAGKSFLTAPGVGK